MIIGNKNTIKKVSLFIFLAAIGITLSGCGGFCCKKKTDQKETCTNSESTCSVESSCPIKSLEKSSSAE